MSLLTAPFYSLFSIDFYKRVLRTSVSKGFLYLVYLSLISCFGTLLFINMRMIPMADEIVAWTKSEMPPLTWTPSGLQLGTSDSAYTMYYPNYGPAVIFDMQKTAVTADDMGESFLFVTSQSIYYRNGQQVTSQSVVSPPNQNYQGPSAIQIGEEVIDNLYQGAKPWIYSIGLLAIFFLTYVSKLIFALFLSLLGMIFNQARRERLPYEMVLNVTFFALTAVTLLDIARLLFPIVAQVTLGFLGSFLVTSIYLFLAIKKTEDSLPAT